MSSRKRAAAASSSDSDSSDDGHDAKQARADKAAAIRHQQQHSSDSDSDAEEKKPAARAAPASAFSAAAASAAAAAAPAAPATAPRRRVFTVAGVSAAPIAPAKGAASHISQMVREQLAKDALKAASEKRHAEMDAKIEEYKQQKDNLVAQLTTSVAQASADNLASLQTGKTSERGGAAAAAASSSSAAASSKQNDAAAGAEADFEQHAQLPIAQHRVGRGLPASAYSPACLFFRHPLSFPRPLTADESPAVGGGRIGGLLIELSNLFDMLFPLQQQRDGSVAMPDMMPELFQRIQELHAIVLAGKSGTAQCNRVKELMWRLCAFVKDAEVSTRASEYLHAFLHHESIAVSGVTRLPGSNARLQNSSIKLLLPPEFETRERSRVRCFSAASEGWVPSFADLIEVVRAYGGDIRRQDTMIVEEDDATAPLAAPPFSPPSSSPVASLPKDDLSTRSLFDHNLHLVLGLFLTHLKTYPHSRIFRDTQERCDCILLCLRLLLDDVAANNQRDHRFVLKDILAAVVEGIERDEVAEAAGAASPSAAAASTADAPQLSDASFNRLAQLFLSPCLSSTPLVLASVLAHLYLASHLLKHLTRSAAQALATSIVQKQVSQKQHTRRKRSQAECEELTVLSFFASRFAVTGLVRCSDSTRPSSRRLHQFAL